MKKFLLSLAALMMVCFSVGARTLECNLSALPETSENTTWDAATNTFAWTTTWYNSTEVFKADDYSAYTTLNYVAEAGTTDHFRIIFRFSNGADQVTYNPAAVGTKSLTWADMGVNTKDVKFISSIRISGASDGAGDVKITSLYLEGPDSKIYDPIMLVPANVTELSQLTGTNTNWANTVVYPKELAVQGQSFGDGDGSNEATHVNVPENSKLVLNVSQGSTGLALRVWLWNGSGVTTLFAHPEDEYETADFTQEYLIKTPGVYSVNLNGYTKLKGIKAQNNWGASALKVNYAYIIPNTYNDVAVDEARTFSSSEILNFSEVEDVEAYIATAVAGDKVAMQKVTGAVPANTGIILVDKSGKSILSIPTCGEATENVAGNLLVATTEDTNVPSGAYVLAGEGDALGWYSIGSTPATLAAGKCYLAAPSSSASGAKSLKMTFGDATAIKNVEKVVNNNAIYSLQGIKVATPVKGNMYIMNGKKVIY